MIGAGVRVVTRSVVLPRSRVARRRRSGRLHLSGVNGVKHRQPVARARPSTAGWMARFENDRELIAVKVALVGAAVLIAMALEVPW